MTVGAERAAGVERQVTAEAEPGVGRGDDAVPRVKGADPGNPDASGETGSWSRATSACGKSWPYCFRIGVS